MLILSWNVNCGPPEKLIAKIEDKQPDIITLQEVRVLFANKWAKRLREIGFNVHLSGKEVWRGKKVPDRWYHCLIASRWDLTPDGIKWREKAPYRELLGRATVSVPDEGDLDVFTAHIPNGSGYGWEKIDTFHVLSAELRGASDSPRILTGDFNEPESFKRSGEIVTFVEGTHEVGGKSGPIYRDKFRKQRQSRPSIEWTNGVLSVLGGVSHHGLRDAYRDRRGFGWPTPVTHRTKSLKEPRCFDHTFVSRHFEVVNCGYFHEWRKAGLSDHSPMWTELRLRTDLPGLKQWADDRS